jgi:hypothetical protein
LAANTGLSTARKSPGYEDLGYGNCNRRRILL